IMKKNPVLLFIPGNRREFVEKAAKYEPDAIIIDLEDAVAIHLKEKVRLEVAELIPTLAVECIVRVNNEPEYLEKDLEAVVSKHIFGIMLPKVESMENLREVDGILSGLEKKRGLEPDSIKLLIMIETALGVIRCYELASALRRNFSVVCSSGEEGDLQTSLNCGFAGLYYSRAKILLDSKAAGIRCILDGVWSNIKDEEGLKKDCLHSKELGYDGRALIYPKHISIARQVYSPSPEQLAYYTRMLEAFAQAEAQGLAAVNFEGQMIDYAMIKKAKAILAAS
ncbi:MAG TPA: CoA ester lyase, partial [Syntrophus sp. (in: bacteria)]|nr:CoA ester lyase [Syntrophus sp. (in: bacteria)]